MGENRKKIDEIFILRAIACLCVVLLHSIAVAQLDIGEEGQSFLISARSVLAFATPTFVFISELLIAYSYPNGTPKRFLDKRIKYILIPYLVMAMFYAMLTSGTSISGVFRDIIFNAFGGYHGYFVLIIFQFYILHILFHRYLSKAKPSRVIIISLVINVAYLAFFNFYQPATDSYIINTIWSRGHWLPFIGWIFYFVLAFYCGKHYEEFRSYLVQRKSTILTLFLCSLVTLLLLVNTGVLEPSSKVFIMPIYASFVIFVVYLLAMRVKVVPRFLSLISRYSFGIYLLHMMFLILFDRALKFHNISFGYMGIPIFFIVSTVGSISIIYALNKFTIGKYVVGRIGKGPKELKNKNNDLKHMVNT